MDELAHAGPEYLQALERLRAECADWPGVTETTSWGNPTFKANGKAFAVLDRYSGSYCVWLRCGSEQRQALVEREGYFPAPYDRQKQAVCRSLEGLNWSRFRRVLRQSYESVMPG